MGVLFVEAGAARGASGLFFYPSSHVSRDLFVSLVNLYVSFVHVLCAFMAKSGRLKGMKFQLKANIFLEKFVFEMNKMVQVNMCFLADTYSVISHSVSIDQLNSALRDVEAHSDYFVERRLGWAVKKVSQFCLTVNSFKLFKGGCKKGSSLSGRLRMMRSCITIDSPPNSNSDRCFLNCLVASIARVPGNPSQWCAQYLEIERLLLHYWPNKCSFPVTSRNWKSIDRHCPVSVNIYGYEKGVIFPMFLSTYRDSKPFHVALL